MNISFSIVITLVFLVICGCGTSKTSYTSSVKPMLTNEPFLRIDPGMHTGIIRRIDVDKKGEWLVTSSEDKTVRLWEIKTRKLVRTYRVPSDDSTDGRLYAVAISPDARFIATGGRTKLGSENGYTIYLFDRISGKLVNRIKDLPASVLHLEYSPDGSRLAAALNDSKGIREYRTSDYYEIFKTDNCNGSSYGVAYAQDLRLATICNDGMVRIYDAEHRQLVQRKMPPSNNLSSVAFSPDGNLLAVGFDDFGSSLLRVSDLKHAQDLDYSGLFDNDSLQSVAFSADGRHLYAGFGSTMRAKLPIVQIRRWNLSTGRYIEVPVADNIIFNLKPLPNGEMIYSSGSPSFGIINNMNQVFSLKLGQPETRRSEIFASDDGAVFLLENIYGKTIPFSIGNRGFDRTNKVTLNPRNRKEDLYWVGYETDLPKLIGVKVELVEGEKITSAVGCYNSDNVVVGSSWNLRLVTAKGEIVWQTPTKAEPWAVTVTKNLRYVIAAYDDGTFRWYRMTDGEEILAFYSNQGEWVLWTPEGYFDASAGGTNLIGYHQNQGNASEAKFISISNLYDVFYRPDIVQAKFMGEDIRDLITLTAKEALKTPPPEVEFTAIPDKSSNKNAKVCYRIKSSGGGIGEVRLFQNGKLVKSDGFYRELAKKESPERRQIASINSRAIYQEQRSLLIRDQNANFTAISTSKGDQVEECVEIETIAGENEISLAAFNAPNTVQGIIKTTSFTSSRKADEPHLYIISVGIDKYRDSSINLKYAAKDAKDFIVKFPEKARSIYKPSNIHILQLSDSKAGKKAILKAIDDLSKKVKHGDGFIFFNASHGVLLHDQYYIVTADFNGDLNNSDALISSNEIVDISKKIKSLSQLFIFDTCHAGGVDNIVSGLYDARMVNLARKMGLHIFASAGSVQTALDGYMGNGLYTYTLLQGIANGNEVDKSGNHVVTVKKLGQYSKEKTTEISTKLGHPQTPFIINFGHDNQLFKVKQ